MDGVGGLTHKPHTRVSHFGHVKPRSGTAACTLGRLQDLAAELGQFRLPETATDSGNNRLENQSRNGVCTQLIR